jgi:hypothetical protein
MTARLDVAKVVYGAFMLPWWNRRAFAEQDLSGRQFDVGLTEKQGTPRGVATPYLRRISFAWYSWIFIGALCRIGQADCVDALPPSH